MRGSARAVTSGRRRPRAHRIWSVEAGPCRETDPLSTSLLEGRRLSEHVGILRMDTPDKFVVAEDGSHVQDDLRSKIAAHLLERLDQIAADAGATFPYSGLG